MKIVLTILAFLVYVFFGALDIMDAAKYYKKEQYFRFGLNCMFAFVMCVCILDLWFN